MKSGWLEKAAAVFTSLADRKRIEHGVLGLSACRVLALHQMDQYLPRGGLIAGGGEKISRNRVG